MEDVSSRRSSNDEYGTVSVRPTTVILLSLGSFAEMEQVHDVMSLELSHHQLGDGYLDPRSFGDGGTFEEFGGPSQGEAQRYEVPHHGYEQQQRAQYHPPQTLPREF